MATVLSICFCLFIILTMWPYIAFIPEANVVLGAMAA